MRLGEIKPAVGRTFQHIEDLIYIDGAPGAMHALERLNDIQRTPYALEMKWDGSPAIMFGNDGQGFGFADKYKKEPYRTAKQVQDGYRGDGSKSRLEFASHMAEAFELYRIAAANLMGYVEAGLMYYPGKPPILVNGELEFQANTVKYLVKANSELGKKISASKTGAAITARHSHWGGPKVPISDVWKHIGSHDVVIIPPKFIEKAPKLKDTKPLQLKITLHEKGIEQFITPTPGIAQIRNIIYRYCNQKRASGQWQAIGKDFEQYISSSPELSDKAKEKVLAKVHDDRGAVKAMFEIVREIIKIKISILNQVESASLGSMGIRAQVWNGKKWLDAGEGVVHDPIELSRPLKLVHPDFTAANANKERA